MNLHKMFHCFHSKLPCVPKQHKQKYSSTLKAKTSKIFMSNPFENLVCLTELPSFKHLSSILTTSSKTMPGTKNLFDR